MSAAKTSQLKAGPESQLTRVSYVTGNILYCHLCFFPCFSEIELIVGFFFLFLPFFVFLALSKLLALLRH